MRRRAIRRRKGTKQAVDEAWADSLERGGRSTRSACQIVSGEKPEFDRSNVDANRRSGGRRAPRVPQPLRVQPGKIPSRHGRANVRGTRRGRSLGTRQPVLLAPSSASCGCKTGSRRPRATSSAGQGRFPSPLGARLFTSRCLRHATGRQPRPVQTTCLGQGSRSATARAPLHACRGPRRLGFEPLLAPPADTGEEPAGSCAPQLDHHRAVGLFHLTVPGPDRVRHPGSQDAVLHARGFALFHRLADPFEPLRQGLDRWRPGACRRWAGAPRCVR